MATLAACEIIVPRHFQESPPPLLTFFFWRVPSSSLLQSHIDRARRFNTSFRREFCRPERQTARSVACVRMCVVVCIWVLCVRACVRVYVYVRRVAGSVVYCFGIIVGAVRTFRRRVACLETESQTP